MKNVLQIVCSLLVLFQVTLLRSDDSFQLNSRSSYPETLWGSVLVTVHSPEEANEFFELLKNRRAMAWDFPSDQCYARAYVSSWILSRLGVKPVTLWNVAPNSAPLLRVETSNDPRGCLMWSYHVAPGVVVANAQGRLEAWVLDPALSAHPQKLWEWVGAMTGHYPAGVRPEVWSSHPYSYRREDLGQERANVLLAEGKYRQNVLDHYHELLIRNRNIVDGASYQNSLKLLRAKIAEGLHPARQSPDPCPASHHLPREFFEFHGERMMEPKPAR